MKTRFTPIITAAMLSIGAVVASAAFLAADPMVSEAAESTFSGTVSDETTPSVLFLKTTGGTMQIKLDQTTDTSAAKFILPGNSVSCNCYTGSDEYWHASKIVGSSAAGRIEVDTSKQATVTGKVGKGTTETLMYLEMSNGTMELKIDTSTDVSGLSSIIIGKNVQAVCARGVDAYMHALSISDMTASAGTLNSVSTTATAATAGNANTLQVDTIAAAQAANGAANDTQTGVTATTSESSISGIVDAKTTASTLYLNTSGGVMEIKIDSTTDTGSCHTLIPSESVSVVYYRGSDACNHASSVTKSSSKASAVAALSGSTLDISGTVSSKTNESTLFLDTSGGVMQIKLDSSTDFSGCRFLLKGKQVNVKCQVGSDEFFHAISISN